MKARAWSIWLSAVIVGAGLLISGCNDSDSDSDNPPDNSGSETNEEDQASEQTLLQDDMTLAAGTSGSTSFSTTPGNGKVEAFILVDGLNPPVSATIETDGGNALATANDLVDDTFEADVVADQQVRVVVENAGAVAADVHVELTYKP